LSAWSSRRLAVNLFRVCEDAMLKMGDEMIELWMSIEVCTGEEPMLERI
jgi:hypothetical protein